MPTPPGTLAVPPLQPATLARLLAAPPPTPIDPSSGPDPAAARRLAVAAAVRAAWERAARGCDVDAALADKWLDGSVDALAAAEGPPRTLPLARFGGPPIDTVPASDLTYDVFVELYLAPGKPVIITGVTCGWRAAETLVDSSGAPNVAALAALAPSAVVPVVDCGDDGRGGARERWTVAEYGRYWAATCAGTDSRRLYLKDAHIVRDVPGGEALYSVPPWFADDWLNGACDAGVIGEAAACDDTPTPPPPRDDYRFLYVGPAGTATPLHADVLGSASWSASVAGVKRWRLLPPHLTPALYDRFGRDLAPDFDVPVDDPRFPGVAAVAAPAASEIEQPVGSAIFVPPGWHHTVANATAALSINHNWVNACTLAWTVGQLVKERASAESAIDDCRSTCTTSEFHALVQRNLAASAGASTAACARLLRWGATRVRPPFASEAAALAAACDARTAAALADVLARDAEAAGDEESAAAARAAAADARAALAAAWAAVGEDLPDDMLHEIFERVFADAFAEPAWLDKLSCPALHTWLPPQGAHAALRCVCRRWRDIADWVRLATSTIWVDVTVLADAGAVRARRPAAFKDLAMTGMPTPHSTSVARAAASLINGSADLRRALSVLTLVTCCLPALARTVPATASCTGLTGLILIWGAHHRERAVPSNVLAPLSALQTLRVLEYGHDDRGWPLPASALLAPLPDLPDAPGLTRLVLNMMGNFVPVGSDATLGRLRRLDFWHKAPVRELLDVEDPFLLRAAIDAGTWQPSRLTGLQELTVDFWPVRGSRAPARPSRTGSRAGSEWAPLADQVTALTVTVKSVGYKRASTGIVAGLGVLTALRELRVLSDLSGDTDLSLLEPVSLDRVRAPHLTSLVCDCASATVSVGARFPNLVILDLGSISNQPPLNLRSLVALSSLQTLRLDSRVPAWPCSINLAELFVGHGCWPRLEELALQNIVLEWDATGLTGAPSAVEFAGRARQLLPALFEVRIGEPRGRGALPDRSRLEFVLACRRHVVPALAGLCTGRGWG